MIGYEALYRTPNSAHSEALHAAHSSSRGQRTLEHTLPQSPQRAISASAGPWTTALAIFVMDFLSDSFVQTAGLAGDGCAQYAC